jgi:hypothetical protein
MIITIARINVAAAIRIEVAVVATGVAALMEVAEVQSSSSSSYAFS